MEPVKCQGYRIWNFPALGRGLRLGFRPLWSSLGRRDAFVRRKLGRRGSNAIALSKRPFTSRLDEEVLAVATRLAERERRSVTAILELAVIEYGERRGITLSSSNE